MKKLISRLFGPKVEPKKDLAGILSSFTNIIKDLNDLEKDRENVIKINKSQIEDLLTENDLLSVEKEKASKVRTNLTQLVN